MRKTLLVLILASAGFAGTCPAQVIATNVYPTDLQTFEARTGTVIIKGAGQVGQLAVGGLEITVISKESLDVSASRKEYGVAVEITQGNQRLTKLVIDDSEMDSLLDGVNYLSKIDYRVTSQPTFVASYVTKSGFRVGAFTSQRQGAIQFFLQDYGRNGPRILITPAQLTQLENLLEQAQKSLTAMRAAR